MAQPTISASRWSTNRSTFTTCTQPFCTCWALTTPSSHIITAAEISALPTSPETYSTIEVHEGLGADQSASKLHPIRCSHLCLPKTRFTYYVHQTGSLPVPAPRGSLRLEYM